MTEQEPIRQELLRFRETEPVDIWSARLKLHIPYSEFEQAVRSVASRNGQRYTGFVTKDDGGHVTSFTRTRYPRRMYGVASIHECQKGMTELGRELNSEVEADPIAEGFRVVLGLIEGYDPSSPVHSVDEILNELPLATRVTPAEVFATRNTGDSVSVYTEPVAVIEAPIDLIEDIYRVGDMFRQERFTIEDFERGVAYVVETRFCTEPD